MPEKPKLRNILYRQTKNFHKSNEIKGMSQLNAIYDLGAIYRKNYFTINRIIRTVGKTELDL